MTTSVLRPAAALEGTVIVAVAGMGAVAAAAVGGPRGLGVGLAIALVGPLTVAVVRRPQRGLLVLAALVPFDGLLLLVPDSGRVAGWKEALVLLVLVATFVAPASARRPQGTRPPGWAVAAAAFIAVGIASACVVGGSQGLLGAKITFFFLLVAIAAWRCPFNATERDRLVTTLMVTGVVTAAYGIAQQALGATRLHALGYEYNTTIRFAGGFLRSFSTFVQPFPFGFFVMLVLLVGLAQLLEDPRRTRNRLFLLALPILVVGLASSVVRGAWLGLVAGGLYLAVTRYRVLLLAVPVAVVGAFFLPSGANEAVLSSSSSEERVSGWSANVERIAEHPLGEGLGTTGATASRLADESSTTPSDMYQPDNYFVKTAIELGVLGLWFFVLLGLAAFGTAHRAARLRGVDGAFGAGTAAYVVAALVASTVSTFFEIFPMEVYFWLLLTVTSGLAAVPVVPAPHAERRRLVRVAS